MENPEPTPLTAPEDPPEPDTDAEKNPEGEEEENWEVEEKFMCKIINANYISFLNNFSSLS